jgi:PAS domain S-box-containing protein
VSALKLAQRRDEQILDNAVGAILVHDNQSIVYANDAAVRTFGAENSGDLIGHTVQDIVDDEDLMEVHQAQRRALLTGEAQHLESRRCKKLDGSVFLVDASFNPIEWEGKTCLLEEIRDITERQQANDSLRENEKTLRSFYNSVDMMMGIVEMLDDDLLHISDNDAAAHFFGSTASAMEMRTTRELGTPEENIEALLANMKDAKATGMPVHYQSKYPTEDGERALSGTVAFIGEATSGRDRYSFVMRDVTEEKHAEQALQRSEMEASQARQQLLDAIAAIEDAFVFLIPTTGLCFVTMFIRACTAGKKSL